MTTVLAFAVAAVALACPLHMLWRMAAGDRATCRPAAGASAATLRERQRALAQRIEALARAEPHERVPDRH